MMRLLLLTGITLTLAACVSARHPQPQPRPAIKTATPAPNPNAKTAPYEVFGQRYYPITDASGYHERGVASWYGGKFHGRLTANGERYDMHQLTAAHKTLPLPTWVKVTNLRNGTSVKVRVNDRGPFVKNRLIDVSYAAAMQLGMIENGTTLVEVEVLENAPAPGPVYSEPAVEVMTSAPAVATNGPAASMTSAGPTSAGNEGDAVIFVQVGAFGDITNARRMHDGLRNAGITDLRLDQGLAQGLPVHRIQIGPVTSVAYYDMLVTQLNSLGITDTHLVSE